MRQYFKVIQGLIFSCAIVSTGKMFTWDTWHCAELATALARGTASKVEYELRDEQSNEAYLKRVMVSVVRLAHELLVYHNHQYFMDMAPFFDRAHFYSLIGNDATKLIFSVIQARVDSHNPQQNVEDLLSSDDIAAQDNFVRHHVIPEIERIAAFLLTFIDDVKPRLKFAVLATLSATRFIQEYMDQAPGNPTRVVIATVVAAQVMHVLLRTYSIYNRNLFI